MLAEGLEAFVAFTEKILCDGEVDLGFSDTDVAHEGGEVGELVQGIGAVLVPLVEAVDSEGVAEIVDARPVGLGESGFAKQSAKEIEDAAGGEFAVLVAEEEVIGAALGWETVRATKEEVTEAFGGVVGERDEAFFVELGFPEGDRIFVKVEVFERDVECLGEAETAGIDQVDEGADEKAGETVSAATSPTSGDAEHGAELLEGVEVGFWGGFFAERRKAGGGIDF